VTTRNTTPSFSPVGTSGTNLHPPIPAVLRRPPCTPTPRPPATCRTRACGWPSPTPAVPPPTTANKAIADIERFDPQIRCGVLATYPSDLRTALSLGGLVDLTYRDESIDDVRTALHAYGQRLLQVAEKAR
jgi:hypothetical protein